MFWFLLICRSWTSQPHWRLWCHDRSRAGSRCGKVKNCYFLHFFYQILWIVLQNVAHVAHGGRYKYPPWWAALPDVFAAMQSYAAWHSNEQDAFELSSTITSCITQTSAVASAKKKTHKKPICPCHVLDVIKRCWFINGQYINQHEYDHTYTHTCLQYHYVCM